ncbi:MAG: carboxypeptidase regulatory-like domain-containing protein [Chloroflexi bacterium]|nr:carboxypeptidase regulatory-like domain-containing protein [Chloroflexota bacterium]
MSTRSWQGIFSWILLSSLLLGMLPAGGANALSPSGAELQTNPPSSIQTKASPTPLVRYAARSGISAPLREIKAPPVNSEKTPAPLELGRRDLPGHTGRADKAGVERLLDPAAQTAPGIVNMPTPDFNFDGLNSEDNVAQVGFNVAPPDTTGDVGFDAVSGKKFYVQWVNLVYAVWDVSANPPSLVLGPLPGNALWQGFGGICEFNNNGDPIVLFDEAADRWLLTQFGLDFGTPEFHQCIAVSATADPTGTWHLYDFLISTSKMNDYPKFGVWPDAYYMAVNQFTDFGWGGQGVVAFERDKMLTGDPAARMVYFDLPDNGGGMLPADLDGITPPPAGAPNPFVQVEDDAWGAPTDWLRLWEFHVDWSNPAASTFIEAAQLPTDPFDSMICPAMYACIDQPNGLMLDAIPDRLMYRLQYRNLGGRQAMVANHTVNGGGDQAGVRWYELEDSGAGWGIAQQGTYAPDGEHRWMGSIAMDASGNLALGYSLSSSATFPSIRYTGRLAGDPAGQMTQTEVEMATGTYSQEGVYRWGDYSTMSIDPTDDCTFWYTQEYVTGPNPANWGNWNTRIASFKFPTCTTGPRGDLQGVVTELGNGNPVPNVRIDLGGGILTQTDANGFYQIIGLPVGLYDVTASAYGYTPETAVGLEILDGATLAHDFTLQRAPQAPVSGVVTDAGHGYPLYARIDITTLGHAETIFTNPLTGEYNVILYQAIDYTFNVNANAFGFTGEYRQVIPPAGGATENFALLADAAQCTAPGYAADMAYFETFEAGDGGYTVDGVNASWAWGEPTSGPGAAHSGANAWATNLAGNYNDNEYGDLTSPPIDLSAFTGQELILSWWQWLQTESGYDYARVEVSNDGGASWTTYWGPVSGNIDLAWARQSILLNASYAVSGFRVRFHLDTDGSVTYPGFYVDDVGVQAVPANPALYAQDFEANNGGFTASGVTSWEWGTPVKGPGAAYSGVNVWATGLAGGYGANEDGYVTSPDIDLSAAAGNSTLLSWQQFFQSEPGYDYGAIEISNDGGATWSLLWDLTGVWDYQWNPYSWMLDPSYAVSNFRIRFKLTSDATVNYPGFYIDDLRIEIPPAGPPTPACNALPGGMAVGHVYDANTAGPLNDALVENGSGGATATFATPDDPLQDDGLYTLFAPAGLATLTASLNNYASDARLVSVPLSATVEQNFSLPAGWLQAAPSPVEVTLGMSATATAFFTITNNGGLPASFELVEADAGMAPLLPGAPVYRLSGSFTPYRLGSVKAPAGTDKHIPRPDVPPWTDISDYPSAIMDNAADLLDGLVYSVGGFDGFGNINSAARYDPAANAWSWLAGMSNVREKPAAAFVDGLLYVTGGWSNTGDPVSALEIYDPTADAWSSGAPAPTGYAAATGVSLDGYFYVIGGCGAFFCGSADVFRYDPAVDSWTTLAPYPEPTSWLGCGALDGLIYCAGGVSDAGESQNTFVYDPGADAWTQLANLPQTQWGMGYAAANGKLYISGGVTDNFATITNETFAYDPASDTWATDANSNNLVYRGGSACGFYKIGGSIGGFNPIAASEVYPGLDECGLPPDVPWLSTSPITGTLSAGASQVIQVDFDTRLPEINQPGTYLAEIKVKENTPYVPQEIPVNMTVTPPADWGRLTGVVTGLGYCDAAGSWLNGADVLVNGVSLTSSAADGSYAYWLAEGEYLLGVAAEGFTPETIPVTVTAGVETITDFELRFDAPCAGLQPQGLDFRLIPGESVTATLTITNAGAAGLGFNILESPFDLTPPAVVSGTHSAAAFAPAAPVGPASARSLNVPSLPSEPEAPDSAWFGGLDLPGGAVRYAHAQCDEDPAAFYVISGVNGRFDISTQTWRYSAVDNAWTELAPIPAGGEGYAAACFQGKIYVMGGGSDQFYIYDIGTDSWSAAPALPRPVWGAAAAAWRGKVYLVGGDADFYFGGSSAAVDIYDIASDTWSSGAFMPFPAVAAGYLQMGPSLFLAGGWGDASPTQNITATQRYDLDADAWELGPEFTPARSDFALAGTSNLLFAIGGDSNGGGPFDPSNGVDYLRLDLWPASAWTDYGDPLPQAVTSQGAGFCTSSFFSAEVRSVGGFDGGAITGANRFLGLEGEACYNIYRDVPWLSTAPVEGKISPDSVDSVTALVDSAGLPSGVYDVTLALLTGDPYNPHLAIPVRVEVLDMQEIYLPLIVR